MNRSAMAWILAVVVGLLVLYSATADLPLSGTSCHDPDAVGVHLRGDGTLDYHNQCGGVHDGAFLVFAAATSAGALLIITGTTMTWRNLRRNPS